MDGWIKPIWPMQWSVDCLKVCEDKHPLSVDKRWLFVDSTFRENPATSLSTGRLLGMNREAIVIPGLEQVIHKFPGVIND